MNPNNSQEGMKKVCPDAEQLGIYTDSPEEYPEITLHLEQCQECQKKVEAYRQIDGMLGELLDAPVPATLSEDIMDACTRDAEREAADRLATLLSQPRRKLSSFFSVPLRYAATLLAVAALSALATAAWLISPGSENSNIQFADAGILPDTPAAFSLVDSRKILAPAAAVNNQDSTIPVSMHSGNAAPTSRIVSRLLLPGEITHVWVSDDGGRGADGLKRLLADHADRFKVLAAEEKDDITSWEIICRDEDIQKVADQLYLNAGWQLLSPAYPQPGERDAVAFTGKNVKYNLKLVRK